MKMTLYFDAATRGFYDSAIHEDIPDGAVEITPSQHESLMDGQSSGMVISANEHGQPILTERSDQAPPVPVVVSRFQARMALRNADLFEAAGNAVYESRDALLIEAWESAVEYRRLSPSIMKLGAALGLDDAAIDDLFRQAATITA